MNNDPNANKPVQHTAPVAPAAPKGAPAPVKVELSKEEDIVVELSPKDKKKKNMTFVAIGFCVLMLFVPFLLRALDPSYVPKKVEKLVKAEVDVEMLNCSITSQSDKNKRLFEISSKYVDSKVVSSKFKYSFSDINDNVNEQLDPSTFDLDEYNKILLIKSNAISKQQQGNSYTIDVDYEKDEAIKKISPLTNHNKDLGPQKKIYEDKDAGCSINKQPSVTIEKIILVEKK